MQFWCIGFILSIAKGDQAGVSATNESTDQGNNTSQKCAQGYEQRLKADRKYRVLQVGWGSPYSNTVAVSNHSSVHNSITEQGCSALSIIELCIQWFATAADLLFALTLQFQSWKCCALGEFLIKVNMYYKHNPSSACIVYLHCWPQLG